MTRFTPTPEQAACLDAFATGDSLVIEAGAGTGKTSTLTLLADAAKPRKGLYVAFNKAIAVDAQAKFGPNVKVRTVHALAMQAIGYTLQERLNGPRVTAQATARYLGIRGAIALNPGSTIGLYQPATQARLALDMVKMFCASGGPELSAAHLRPQAGIGPDGHATLARALLPYAQKAWDDMTQPVGELRTTHDVYLKLWQLSDPDWGADFILYDEAQDATGVASTMVASQQRAGAQLCVVGDRSQAIYGWRGAVDAMDDFDAPHKLQLSQSWRFGPAIADQANRWLAALGASLRLTGNPNLPSRVAAGHPVDAVLCRTNGGTLHHVITNLAAGRSVALVGGGADAIRLAEAAKDLQAGKRPWHPELAAFTTWGQVQDYVEEGGDGGDLKAFVKLVDTHGPDKLIVALNRLAPEERADVVVSTAHKAKGREWDSVLIHDDFPDYDPHATPTDGPRDKSVPEREELMLAYVAVTRAKLVLDPDGLSWLDAFDGRVTTPAAGASRPVLALVPTPASTPTPSRAAAPQLAKSLAGPVPVDDPWAIKPLHIELTDNDALRVRLLAADLGVTPAQAVSLAVKAARDAQRQATITAVTTGLTTGSPAPGWDPFALDTN